MARGPTTFKKGDNVGIKNPMYGRKHSKETKEKIKNKRLGKKIPTTSGKNHYKWKGGIPKCLDCDKLLSTYNVKRCKKCSYKFRSGANNNFWKGGISPINKSIRKLFEYRQWRSDVFQRDDYTCQECNIRGVSIQVHHIKEFSTILGENNILTLEDAINCEELWNINNGVTLCVDCHKKTDSYMNRWINKKND